MKVSLILNDLVMKVIILFIGFILSSMPAKTQPPAYDIYPVYAGKDLGLLYSPTRSVFRIWAPSASAARLILYNEGIGGKPLQNIAMTKGAEGTWFYSLDGDQQGIFYVFSVRVNEEWLGEVPDPYAKAVGVNGRRALIADLHATNPSGWEHDISPVFRQQTDAIIYELHIRDASIASNSGIKAKGLFSVLWKKARPTKKACPPAWIT